MERFVRFFQFWLSLMCAVGLNLALVSAATAQWKWRDAQGAVQYSDRPPPLGIPDKDVLGRPATSNTLTVRQFGTAPATAASAALAASQAGSDPATSRTAQNAATRKRDDAAAAEAKRKADEDKLARQRADNCQRARDYVRTLESGMRVARLNDKGEREVINDDQRAQELQRSQGVVASECH
ncbi:MAG: DUF4124 domain-containing protein [Leptothrix sp. (in: b-proteobacteria)]